MSGMREIAPGFLAAERVDHLGTELVFAVAAEAAELAAAGRAVYPFHMGEVDFPTPANVVEACVKALRDGKTKYTPNAGLPELREALAADVGRDRGVAYTADNVAVQPAGKPVIGKFLLALMDRGDEVLYPNPGFPIYSSLIEFFGGTAVPYTYLEGPDRFRVDLEGLERSHRPPHAAAHPQRHAQPHGHGVHRRGARDGGSPGAPTRPLRALRRGLLRHPLLGQLAARSSRCRAWRSAA